MKILQVMIEHAENTLDEVYEYYKDYVMFKDDNIEYANLSLDLARTHLNLYDKLHSAIVNTINRYKNENAVPSEMQKIWDYEHEKLIEEYDELKYKINNA